MTTRKRSPAQQKALDKASDLGFPNLRHWETGEEGELSRRVNRERKDQVNALARAHSEEAISELVKIMKNRNTPVHARIKAANSILDRAYGKPPRAIQVTGRDGEPIRAEGIHAELDAKTAASLYKRFVAEIGDVIDAEVVEIPSTGEDGGNRLPKP